MSLTSSGYLPQASRRVSHQYGDGDRVRDFEPKNFLSSCLLLLLLERPDHGYGLVSRLDPFGIGDLDTGTVYRALRSLERRGCLCSDWSPSNNGPDRRIYRLTEKGCAALSSMLEPVQETRRRLDYYLRRLAPLVDRRAVPRADDPPSPVRLRSGPATPAPLTSDPSATGASAGAGAGGRPPEHDPCQADALRVTR
jgi:PadR family transcriptional regulator PadR